MGPCGSVQKISANAFNDTLVTQPTSSHYCNVHATTTYVRNENTLKPVLKRTWIEKNPDFTGEISPSHDSLI
jgi:hypothetical protein